MFVKRKSSRPTRERLLDDGEDDTEESGNMQDSPSTLAAKLKKKSKPKVKSRLSFGGDNEEDEDNTFQVRKSGLRQSLVMGEGGVVSNANPDISNLSLGSTSSPQPQGSRPTYSKQYLEELRMSTPSSARPRPPSQELEQEQPFDIEGAVVENLDDFDVSMADDSTTQTQTIPTQSSIRDAKETRTHLRAHPELAPSKEEDFVSLTVSRFDGGDAPERESRLVREDDEVGDAEDEMAEYTGAAERIALGRKSRKKEARERRAEIYETIADAQDEVQDEDALEWEHEQVRRNVPQKTNGTSKEKTTYKPTPIPPPTPLPSLDPSIFRLSTTLKALTTQHASTTHSLSALAAEEEALEAQERGLRKSVVTAEEKRTWFEQFRGRMEDVGSFLDVKFPKLEAVEKDFDAMLKERSQIVNRRRMLEDGDDLSVFVGPLATAHEEKEEKDEFGRSKEGSNESSLRERNMARSRRRQAKAEDEEGYSTSSSLSPSDAQDFASAQSDLASRVKKIMSDVNAPEYRDPALGIAEWFAEWRREYKEGYMQAWGGLGLVGAWEFWARLEIAGWDPITEPKPLDSFAWFTALHAYSHQDEPEEDDLAAAMVSTAFTPRLCALLTSGAMDPYSSKHVKRMVELCEEVECYVPRGDVKFQAICQSVLVPFREAMTGTSVLIKSTLNANPRAKVQTGESTNTRRRFINRRLKLLSNLIRWRKYAGDLFGLGILVGEVIEKCILPVLDRGGEDGERVKGRVREIVPSELLPASMR